MVTAYFFPVLVVAAGRRSTTPIAVATFGVLHLAGVVRMKRTTSTSSKPTTIGETAETGIVCDRSQNNAIKRAQRKFACKLPGER